MIYLDNQVDKLSIPHMTDFDFLFFWREEGGDGNALTIISKILLVIINYTSSFGNQHTN